MPQNIHITADAIIFYKYNKMLKVLLIKRKNEPFKNRYAFPGGFVDNGEVVIEACQRELKEETGLKIDIDDLRFINYYDQPDRDPRGRTITFAYAAIIAEEKLIKGSDDAETAEWVDIKDIKNLAFDHRAILKDALEVINQLCPK
ncbi:NUDIX domain-containing protein [Mesohalobacter salilacus]|uniref:NUDIX domain-containing protein n=1 Tax=Mesohalobacter salilacus TaxID=2491711 RepID=UPI0026990D06